MAKEKAAPVNSFLQGLFHLGVYKGSQGKITRQATFGVLAVVFFLGASRLFVTLKPQFAGPGVLYLISAAVVALGLWVSYRIVNYPKFADFLIAVEAEMNKVSWPTRLELIRSSIVVILVIVALAAILFAYDLFWKFVFGPNALGILKF